MFTSNVVVLRRKDVVIPTMDNMGGGFRPYARLPELAGFRTELDLASSITVETGEMTSKELGDLRRDREVLAAAPSMPLEPITPKIVLSS